MELDVASTDRVSTKDVLEGDLSFAWHQAARRALKEKARDSRNVRLTCTFGFPIAIEPSYGPFATQRRAGHSSCLQTILNTSCTLV